MVLSDLINHYVREARAGGRDCRLLVPGLDPGLSRQVHRELLGSLPGDVAAYLVTGSDEQTSEETGYIRAVGLTSKRIGSFVAIVDPGQLAHIQDSIRGSGGPIRSLVFSEEWPWIDNGNESFRFDGPVLNALVQRWTIDEEEQKWFRELILGGLLEATRTHSQRTQVFLISIIGQFDPERYPDINGVRTKFLFHSGIPSPVGELPSAQALVKNSARLSKKIVDRCAEEGATRDQVRDMVQDVIPEEEREAVTRSLDRFLDGIGRSQTLDLGLLAFYGCWDRDDDTSHWSRLNSGRLEAIFGIPQGERSRLVFTMSCPGGIIAEDGKTLASYAGVNVDIEVNYDIPPDQLASGDWRVEIRNRGTPVVSGPVDGPTGNLSLHLDTANIPGAQAKKIPLRIALVSNDEIRASQKLDLHLCGPNRPAFAVVENGFKVVDATPAREEEDPGTKINLDVPVHVFMLAHGDRNISIRNEDDEEVVLIGLDAPDILRSAQRLDLSGVPSGQDTWTCSFGELEAVINFESTDIEKGEFTIEDEFRVLLSSSKTRDKSLGFLVDLFQGETREPYLRLGRIDDKARNRIQLAKLVTTRTGWKPVLTNLLEGEQSISGAIGDFFAHRGKIDPASLAKVTLPAEVVPLLKAYSDARWAVIQRIESNLDTGGATIEHPVYASHPVFVKSTQPETEALIVDYISIFSKILDYIRVNKKNLERPQLLVLAHLDCIVHWDNTRMRNAFFLVGPWHPLVVAKRFMVQAALHARARRFLDRPDGKKFKQLTSLLEQVQGFRWVPGLSMDVLEFEPAIVSTSSDPGWHVAIKADYLTAPPSVGCMTIAEIVGKLWKHLGLEMEKGADGNTNLPVTVLSSFMRAFPSRRSIGMRVRKGYPAKIVIENVDAFLHAEEGPTEFGARLPGGLRLYLEKSLDQDVEARWTSPPLCVYHYENDEECIAKASPDIYMLPAESRVSTRASSKQARTARGHALEAVFSMPLGWLTEGQFLVPASVTYDFDPAADPQEGLGGAFTRALGETSALIGNALETTTTVDLPQLLGAPWVVIPGRSIDPAVLVKYVRDGKDRGAEERALWDYRIDIAGKANSFYVLSRIPREFQVAVNGFFGRVDVSGDFILDLGKIGIAIGGEALKTGRNALGVIGLVGAVRMLAGSPENGISSLGQGPGTLGFLLPVDSFASFFGDQDDGPGKRADLLAVHLSLPDVNAGKLRIAACGIEAKFVTGTFSLARASGALAQGISTEAEFRGLLEASLGDGAMPERLALLELLRFGLRITSPGTREETERWVENERRVYDAVLTGNYEYSPPTQRAVLFSTEGRLQGAAEYQVLQDGLWVRLTRDHWPGIAESPAIEQIQQKLCTLFYTASSPGTPRIIIGGDQPPAGERIGQAATTAGSPGPQPTAEEQFSSPKETPTELPSPREDRGAPLERIIVGVDTDRRAVYFDPQSQVDPLENNNVMITGSSGTGKTQFLKYLILKLREQGKNVLVLDFKNDFADDQTFCEKARLERIFVNFDGLPYNPLIPYPMRHPGTGEYVVQCGQHIAGLSAVLKQTYRLGDQQQVAVKNAIAGVFRAEGIPDTGTILYDPELRFPDFSAVGAYLQANDPLAYNRLDPLFTLDLFREENRDRPFQALVGRSVVLDLSRIPSDDLKSTLAKLIVLSGHSYLNTQPHSGAIRQFFVFDEGHRVLDSTYMASMARECRAYGVGVILSSQYPSDFPGEISASMATKILHGNGRDTERIRGIVNMIGFEGHEGEVANLEPFQGFIDNRHYPHTLLRTMNYPLYLAWSELLGTGTATRDELSTVDGLDVARLPIANLVRQLERMGIAEERDGRVHPTTRT